MRERDTEWIMKIFTEMAIQINHSLPLAIDLVGELTRIRSANDKDAESPPRKRYRKGLGGAVRVQQGSIQVPFAFGAGDGLPVRFGKVPTLGELNLSGRKKTAIEETVGFERILRQRVVQSPLCQGAVPCFAKKLGMDVRAKPVTRRFRVGSSEFLPGEGAFFDPFRQFPGQMHSGNLVFFKNPLVGLSLIHI